MPINFVTGLPRQGKTLWTLAYVQEIAKKDNRQVYTCNIPEVTIEGWQTIDHPDKWMELPNDSIIIVDELQDFWGQASTGARVPMPILELSKHGKRGIDFFFITQDPTLVHATPRKLAAAHYHVIRAFGTEKAMIHKWPRMQTDPEKHKKTSEKFPWAYPRAAFGKKDKAGNVITPPWYKSADVHNIKREIPLKVWAIPIGAVVAGLAIWAAFGLGNSVLEKAKTSANGGKEVATAPGGALAPGQASGEPPANKHMTVAEYLESRRPRIPDLPHTAPAYDEVTKPVTAPYPAACIQDAKRCMCYTQQGTLMRTSGEVCKQIVQYGYFVDWDDSKGRRDALRQEVRQDQQARQQIYAHGGDIQPVVSPEALRWEQQMQYEGYEERKARENAQVVSKLRPNYPGR